MAHTKEQNRAYYKANKEKILAYTKAYNEANKEKKIAYNKKYYQKNKKKIALKIQEYDLKKNYNITLKEKNIMLKKQNNKCKICYFKFDENEFKSIACIDHCHTANKIRGLLCRTCNMGLGLFKDNTENLTNAITYLKEAETLPEELK